MVHIEFNIKNILNVFIIITVLVLIISYIYIKNNYKYIKDNWKRYKCVPYYSPFAGLFFRKKGESVVAAGIRNSTSCMWVMIKSFFKELIKPVQYILNIIFSLLNQIKDILQTFRKQLIVIRKMLLDIFKNVMKRLEDILTMFIYTFLKLQDSTKKSFAAFKQIVYMVQTTGLTLESMIAGPVGDLARLAGQYGYLMTYFLLGPISIKMFPSLWLPVLCFDPNTIIPLYNGHHLKIKYIKIGDKLEDSSIVEGIHTFLNIRSQMYYVHGDIVSENHMVQHKGQWLQVKNHPHKQCCQKPIPTLINLTTSTHKIKTLHNTYLDWEEYSHSDFIVENKNHILLELNLNKEISKWSKDHLYQEGFYFIDKGLKSDFNKQLGQQGQSNIIIGKSICKANYIKWYCKKSDNQPRYIVSGSTIIYEASSQLWKPVYEHIDFMLYKKSLPSFIYQYVTLSGNLTIDSHIYKDFTEIRSDNYEKYYYSRLLKKLNH